MRITTRGIIQCLLLLGVCRNLQAEEATESVKTLISDTTISGYVSTSSIWRPGTYSSYPAPSQSVVIQIPLVQWESADGGNDHWYGVVPLGMSWNEARSSLLAQGADLAAITSPAEQAFVESRFFEAGSPFLDHPLWIGMDDSQSPGELMWRPDNEPVSFSNWATGDPSLVPGEVSYGVMNLSLGVDGAMAAGQWDLVPGGGLHASLIELATPVPEPATWCLLAAGCALLQWKRAGKGSKPAAVQGS